MSVNAIADDDTGELKGVQAIGLTPTFDEAEYGQYGDIGSILTTRTYKSFTGNIDFNDYNEDNYGRLMLNLTSTSAVGLNPALNVDHDVYINIKDSSDTSKLISSLYLRGINATRAYNSTLTGVETKRADLKGTQYCVFPDYAIYAQTWTATSGQVSFSMSKTPVQYLKKGGTVDTNICKCSKLSGRIIRLDVDGVERTDDSAVTSNKHIVFSAGTGAASGAKVRAFYLYDGTA
jgi:hypothetical protein